MFKQHALILGLVLAVTIHAYDELVLAIAMPAITADLDGFHWYGLAFSSYLLATLIGVVWAGQDTDKQGPLKVFMWGYFAFGLGLVLSGSAQSMEVLIVGRALQGLGGGISWTVAFAVINLAFEETKRPKMIAMLDVAWVVPSLIAPVIGGLFIDYAHWRWIFFTQLPVLIVTAILLYPHFARLQKPTKQIVHNRLPAAYLLTIGAAVLLYISNQAISWLWLLAIPAAIFSLKPLLSLMPKDYLSHTSALSILLSIHALIFASFYGIEIFLPVLTTNIFNYSALQTGLFIAVGACTWCFASLLQARISQRLSTVRSLLFGFLCFGVGIALLFLSHIIKQSPWPLYLSMGACGFGMGMAFNTCMSAAMSQTKEGKEGATSTSLGIMSSLSIALVSGIGGAVLNIGERSGVDIELSLVTIWSIAGCCALIAVLVFLPRLHRMLKEA